MHITDKIIREIRESLPLITLHENEPMSAHSSFRIGGRVRAMAMPSSSAEISELCRILLRAGERPFVMGNGTNLLVADGELDLFVIKMDEGMAQIQPSGDNSLRARCGVPLARLALRALSMGLSGLEFAHGIPGTLGGAVSMNAGAYGGEMKDVVRSTLYLGEDLVIHEKKGSEQGFEYRRSSFSETGDVILESFIELIPGETGVIQSRMRELMEKRRASQPLDVPSAGSTFKRPEGGYAAALIDEAGLKGFAIGGAQVSPKHAGFVVNRGGASFDDVLRLIEHIRETVYRNTGILLEPEVKIIRG